MQHIWKIRGTEFYSWSHYELEHGYVRNEIHCKMNFASVEDTISDAKLNGLETSSSDHSIQCQPELKPG